MEQMIKNTIIFLSGSATGGVIVYFFKSLYEHYLALSRSIEVLRITESNKAAADIRGAFAPARNTGITLVTPFHLSTLIDLSKRLCSLRHLPLRYSGPMSPKAKELHTKRHGKNIDTKYSIMALIQQRSELTWTMRGKYLKTLFMPSSSLQKLKTNKSEPHRTNASPTGANAVLICEIRS
jgi:hypothetical protein